MNVAESFGSVQLDDLLVALRAEGAIVASSDCRHVAVSSVVSDSRQVRPGSIFVARNHPGYSQDGHDFVSDAINRGATAIVTQRAADVPSHIPLVTVPSSAAAFGSLSAAINGFPSRDLGLTAVTGTDGKTTTTSFIHKILTKTDPIAGIASTVALGVGSAPATNSHRISTPEANDVQRLLAMTRDAGGLFAVIEATSHGLDQKRLVGCEVDVAVVTGVTHEHLDYHGDFVSYREAKAGVIDLLAANPRHQKVREVPKTVVIPAADESREFFKSRAQRVPADVLTFGIDEKADIVAAQIDHLQWGSRAWIETPWGSGQLELQMPGAHNILNALAALAATGALGMQLRDSLGVLGEHQGMVGRMERVDEGQPYYVVVDFAHTPNSLKLALETLRARTEGRLLVVFGSAGERDRAKRAMMGQVGALHADICVFTEEDSRGEDAEDIVRQIAVGAAQRGAVEGRDYVCISQRDDAIRFAISLAQEGDTVLLTGKGHETSIQRVEAGRLTSLPWNEYASARRALRSRIDSRVGYTVSTNTWRGI